MSYRQKENRMAAELLDDALSSVSRIAKRNLLLFASLCLIISTTEIKPDTLNLPFLNAEGLTEQYIVYGLILFLIYSYVSFFVHALSDYLKFRHRKDIYDLETAFHTSNDINLAPNETEEFNDREFEDETGYQPFSMPRKITQLASGMIIVIDFIFPLLFGLIAIFISITSII